MPNRRHSQGSAKPPVAELTAAAVATSSLTSPGSAPLTTRDSTGPETPSRIALNAVSTNAVSTQAQGICRSATAPAAPAPQRLQPTPKGQTKSAPTAPRLSRRSAPRLANHSVAAPVSSTHTAVTTDRQARIEQLRREIDEDRYETPDKLNAAAERLIRREFGDC